MTVIELVSHQKTKLKNKKVPSTSVRCGKSKAYIERMRMTMNEDNQTEGNVCAEGTVTGSGWCFVLVETHRTLARVKILTQQRFH